MWATEGTFALMERKVINSITIKEWFLFHWSDNFIIISSSFIMWIIQFPFCHCMKHSEQSPLGEERVYLTHTCRAHSIIEEVRMGLDGKPDCYSVTQHYFWSGNSSTAKKVQQKREGVPQWLPGGSTLECCHPCWPGPSWNIDMLTDQSPPGRSSVETPYLGDFKLHQVCS